jgi:NADP-dependent 3-hydroxy acid dehydrogenase YdfG
VTRLAPILLSVPKGTVSQRFLKDKVVVVTGASSGVGRAISRAAAAEGARVALIARGIDGLASTAREVEALGGESFTFPLDLADASAVENAAERIVKRWGRIDVWVNNAMVSVFSPAREMRASEYRRVMDVNYLGTVHGTLAALEHMRRAGRGLIVQIGSALVYRSIPLQSAYCASKAAIRGFTDSLRSELVHEKSPVRVMILELPAVNTPQFETVRNRLGKHARPVGVIYQPEVIAKAFVYAVAHPSREVWIGWSTIKAILGQLVIPGLLDRHLARAAWEEQLDDALPAPGADNLDAPLPGDRGARGLFDAEAKTSSVQVWLRTHPQAVAFGAVALLVAGVLVGRKFVGG